MDSRTSALHVPHPSAVAAKTEVSYLDVWRPSFLVLTLVRACRRVQEPPREALLFHVVNQLVRVHESLARRCGTASGPAYPPPHEDVHERRRALLCELYSSCLSPLFAEAPSSRHARDARPPEDHTPRWASRSMATMFSETEAAPVVPVGSPQPAVVSSFTTSATTGSPPRRLKRRFTSKSCSRCTTNLTSQWRSGPAGPSTCVVALDRVDCV